MQAETFLTAVLGPDGYQALNKAAQRLPELEDVFIPRTILAWLDCAARLGFEGQVPGTEAQLSKGMLAVDGNVYPLGDDLTPERVRAASALSLSLADDLSIPKDLDSKLVARLAKSVDTLTKARFLKMVKDLEASAQEISPGEATGSAETTQEPVEVSELGKGIEEPGKAAKPRGPAGPEQPVTPRKAGMTGMSTSQPAPVVSRARGFYKSELTKACPRCGETQMRGRQVVGCLCITDVLQSAALVQKSEGDRLQLIGPDAVLLTLEAHLGLTPST